MTMLRVTLPALRMTLTPNCYLKSNSFLTNQIIVNQKQESIIGTSFLITV